MKKLTKSPAFQFYARDFLADSWTRTQDLNVIGAYLMLLCHQWLEGGLPDDSAALQKLAGATSREWPAIWRALAPKFPKSLEDGQLRNIKLHEVRLEREAFRAKMADNGAKGGRKAAGKQQVPNRIPEAEPAANQKPNQNESSASASASNYQDQQIPGAAAPGGPKSKREPAPLAPGWPSNWPAHVGEFLRTRCKVEIPTGRIGSVLKAHVRRYDWPTFERAVLAYDAHRAMRRGSTMFRLDEFATDFPGIAALTGSVGDGSPYDRYCAGGPLA